jgi:excisionase family DNA binding protein
MTKKGNLLSPREAARRLGITLQFVYMELWANRIPGARRLGRHWQIPERAIEERLNRREQKNG